MITRCLSLVLIASAAVVGCAETHPQPDPLAKQPAPRPTEAEAEPETEPETEPDSERQTEPRAEAQPRPRAQEAEARARNVFERGMQYVGRFDTATGEQFCWHARGTGSNLLSGYRSSGETVWLDYAERYLDELVARMAVGPDGYKGFIGPYIYDTTVWCDVHVGDAILINLMLDFAEIVTADETLHQRYGEKARQYTAIGRRDLIEKWDVRGTWREDGPYGGYVSWYLYGDPGDFTNWTPRDHIRNSTMAVPFNKSMDMAVACLRLHRLTGEKAYRDKAAKVFGLVKSRMQLIDDYYVWNYWEPVVATDVDLDAGITRHWMNVHPYRNYQSGEVADIVKAYHAGVVFTEEDIRRIINTNLKVMWNGSVENPEWRNSNHAVPGYRPAPPSEAYPTTAGTLWTALADFDQTIRDLRDAGRRGGRRTSEAPPSFERKHVVGDVETMDFPFHHCPAVTVAAVLPSRMRRDEGTVLVTKVPIDGHLEIALYDADGQEKHAVLFDEDVEGGFDGLAGVIVHQWDAPVPPGDYRIRWTFGDGHREFPIKVME